MGTVAHTHGSCVPQGISSVIDIACFISKF